MRVASEINLTPEERESLMKLARSGLTSVRLAQRARIVLLASTGMQRTRALQLSWMWGVCKPGAGASARPVGRARIEIINCYIIARRIYPEFCIKKAGISLSICNNGILLSPKSCKIQTESAHVEFYPSPASFHTSRL